MPIYTFHCPECSFEEESILSLRERDTTNISCPKCCTFMVRIPDITTIGKPSHQPGVVLENGGTIPGLFGKSAPNR